MSEIAGTGIDLVSVPRIEEIARKWEGRFLGRVFSDREIEYCKARANPYQHFAGRFAAKEAFFKALGRRVSWKTPEVLRPDSGRPIMHLRPPRPSDLPREYTAIHLSISHTRELATASVILERTDPG
ncbi:MAG: holo-ACP synthase [Candidatus Acetothermia bacterium]